MQADRVGGIGLEYLSVFGLPMRDYVDLAARIGCDFVSVNFGKPANSRDEPVNETLRESAPLRREVASAVSTHGLRVELVEGFAITPQVSVEHYAADLDAVTQLGARSICAVSLDKDLARTHEQFAMLAQMAAERGILVTTEVGAGVMRNFQVACASWRAVGHPNFTLLVDTMHFFRRGGTAEDLDAVPASAIGHLQLCDVPMPAQLQSYMDEALLERRCPGDGDLPLASLLSRLSTTVPIGLEVPILSKIEAGHNIEAVLQRCLTQARALIAGAS